MAYKGQERRVDPGNRMGLEWHAPRKFREFEALPLDKRRAAISEAKFRNEGTHTGEADLMRVTLLRALDQLEEKRTSEQVELLKALSGQFERAFSVWTVKFPLEKTPKTAELKAAVERWLETLPAQTLDGISEFRKTARLVVVPPQSVLELLKLIEDNKTVPHQTDSKIWWPEGWNEVRPPKWKFGITNDVEDMPFDPTIYFTNPDAPQRERTPRTNEQMVAEYKRRFAQKGQGLMPQDAYVPAAADVLAEGRVLDRQFYTAFERPRGAAYLPNGGWDGAHMYLGRSNPEGSGEGLRCRPWVEGEMSV